MNWQNNCQKLSHLSPRNQFYLFLLLNWLFFMFWYFYIFFPQYISKSLCLLLLLHPTTHSKYILSPPCLHFFLLFFLSKTHWVLFIIFSGSRKVKFNYEIALRAHTLSPKAEETLFFCLAIIFRFSPSPSRYVREKSCRARSVHSSRLCGILASACALGGFRR